MCLLLKSMYTIPFTLRFFFFFCCCCCFLSHCLLPLLLKHPSHISIVSESFHVYTVYMYVRPTKTKQKRKKKLDLNASCVDRLKS